MACGGCGAQKGQGAHAGSGESSGAGAGRVQEPPPLQVRELRVNGWRGYKSGKVQVLVVASAVAQEQGANVKMTAWFKVYR